MMSPDYSCHRGRGLIAILGCPQTIPVAGRGLIATWWCPQTIPTGTVNQSLGNIFSFNCWSLINKRSESGWKITSKMRPVDPHSVFTASTIQQWLIEHWNKVFGWKLKCCLFSTLQRWSKRLQKVFIIGRRKRWNGHNTRVNLLPLWSLVEWTQHQG